MAVFSEGRWGQPERNNFEVGGHGGVPRLNLQFYRMAVFYEEPGIEISFLSDSFCVVDAISNVFRTCLFLCLLSLCVFKASDKLFEHPCFLLLILPWRFMNFLKRNFAKR